MQCSLCFVVDDDPTRTSNVTVGHDDDIDQLKEVVKKKLSVNVPVTQITIWKLDIPTPLTLDSRAERKAFAEQIKNLQLDPNSDDPPGVVQLRYASRKISFYWGYKPRSGCLQFIVQLPCLEEPPAKIRKIDREIKVPTDMQMLWDRTWGRKEEAIPWFKLRKTERDNTSTEVVPEYRWVLSPPEDIAKALGLDPPTVLFRDDYLRAFTDLFASSGLGDFTPKLDHSPGATFPNFFSGAQVTQKRPHRGFILTGSPGIGKSIWLRILLVLRLSARLPTFYATDATSIFLFTANGPVEIPSNSLELRFYLQEETTAWALFDSSPSLLAPPDKFVESRDIFVVQTPSPRKNCTEWRKKSRINVFCLGLWSLAEMICATPFQEFCHDEQALVGFCKKYGYSARDAYENASSLDKYEASLRAYCDGLSYDMGAKIVSDVRILHFPEDAFLNIFCITPIEVGLKYSVDFVSEHVYHCVLDSLRDSQPDAAEKFYQLFLRMGKTESVINYRVNV